MNVWLTLSTKRTLQQQQHSAIVVACCPVSAIPTYTRSQSFLHMAIKEWCEMHQIQAQCNTNFVEPKTHAHAPQYLYLTHLTVISFSSAKPRPTMYKTIMNRQLSKILNMHHRSILIWIPLGPWGYFDCSIVTQPPVHPFLLIFKFSTHRVTQNPS